MAMIDETSITGEDLVEYLVEAKEHHRMEDFDTGDIDCRIKRYEDYNLGTVRISSLSLGAFSIDEMRVNTIAASMKSGKLVDPIIYDTVNESIIDGNHRANAAAKIGMPEIRAWIGDKSKYRDESYHECMAEKFRDDDEWRPDADEYGIATDEDDD